MKSKKTILAIVLVICVLVAGIFIWKGAGSHNKDPEEEETHNEQEATILEDDGDIVIIIPDGQDSAGF